MRVVFRRDFFRGDEQTGHERIHIHERVSEVLILLTPESSAADDVGVDFQTSRTHCAIRIELLQEGSGVIHFIPFQVRPAGSDTLHEPHHRGCSAQDIGRARPHIRLSFKHFRIIVHHPLSERHGLSPSQLGEVRFPVFDILAERLQALIHCLSESGKIGLRFGQCQ